MKKFNLAALPLAVAGILASTSAFAGTEACFEVYKGADDLAITDFATSYGDAACDGALVANDPARIAYEKTGDLDIDFDMLDGTDTDLQIVYIPTTDIPSGTLITMELSGATFAGNSDIIHLVQYDQDAGTGAFEAVASSDGSVDDETEITFLTKAGVIISAGTRLVLSRTATGASDADLGLIGINVSNDTCTDPTVSQSVTIAATSAVTDGGTGFNIAGGKSSSPELVADISAQFVTFYGAASTAGEVNAESSDHLSAAITARTEFVYEANSLTLKKYQLISKAGFADWVDEMDQAVVLSADDELVTKFVTNVAAGDDVKAGIFEEQDGSTGDVTTNIEVEVGSTYGDIAVSYADATEYETEATVLFADSTETIPASGTGEVFETLSNYNEVYYVLENSEPTEVMNFNYMHTPSYSLDFDDSDLLDHCVATKELHSVSVNGAVLKVPYSFDTDSNWVRITNEHTETAEITLDIFDESGNEQYSVDVGSVGEHASVVLKADWLIDQAIAAGYAPEDDRHTMTFTVTAPRDSVHGVSVQKIPGGVDRVLPVLDQNDWSQ